MTNKNEHTEKNDPQSMEPPEVDNERVAHRAARAKDPEPLDATPPSNLITTEAEVRATRDPIHDAD